VLHEIDLYAADRTVQLIKIIKAVINMTASKQVRFLECWYCTVQNCQQHVSSLQSHKKLTTNTNLTK